MNSVYAADFGSTLFGMLADIAGDIILKTDCHGYIEQATPDLSRLGVQIDGLLIAPHVADLADPQFAPEVREYVREALAGGQAGQWVEFPLAQPLIADEARPVLANAPAKRSIRPQWFALRLRPSPGQSGAGGGALGMLRSIELRRTLEDRLLASALTDNLTGLANRQAFLTTMARRAGQVEDGLLALIEIDSFRALNLRFGTKSGDAMINAFADFLSVMLRGDTDLARLSGARFGFLLSEGDLRSSRAKVEEIVRTFAQLSIDQAAEIPTITASAGMARLVGSVDRVLAQAERALIIARAAGGTRVEIANDFPHFLVSGRRRA